MEISLYTIPALIVLAAKGAIFVYARGAWTENIEARLYILFLLALTVQNIAEIGILNYHGADVIARAEFFRGYLYFGASIVGPALLLHLALVLALDWHGRLKHPYLTGLLYLPVIGLEFILWNSELMITGFERLNYTYGQIGGPAYGLFELYILVYCSAAFAVLLYGTRAQNTPSKRLKNKLMVYGSLPMVAIIALVMGLQHEGLETSFNTTATLPVAVTIFLAITAYAIHQYRLFDIDFYIPWSKVRKRKTAFYNRIRNLIAEIAGLPSAKEAIELLADTLKCPIALIDNNRTIVATTANGRAMTAIPQQILTGLNHIAVADEITTAMPDVHTAMRRHSIAAIVPFYPHARNASGWLLLGDSFKEQVYSPLDFKLVECLFDKMADLFLDRMLSMRSQLAETRQQISILEDECKDMEGVVKRLHEETEQLRRENARLLREQPADSFSLISTASQECSIPATVTLLGRDKDMLERLRKQFPQTTQYVGPTSASFKRQRPPDVLVCQIENKPGRIKQQILKLIAGQQGKTAFLFYGPGVVDFIRENQKELLGHLIEVLPENMPEEALTRRINAIAELRKSVCAITDPDHPLIGRSQVFIDVIAEAIRMSRFFDPVVIKAMDLGEAAAIAKYIHNQSASNGRFVQLRVDSLDLREAQQGLVPEDEIRIRKLLNEARNGTIFVDNVTALPVKTVDQLVAMTQGACNVRLLAGFDAATGAVLDDLPTALQTFVLEMPTLSERRGDMQLLVHYFTLLHNIQAEQDTYLDQAEVDSLQINEQADNLASLKSLLFERLGANEQTQPTTYVDYNTTSRTLEDYVAEFEASIITQTLERCDGNKSKAARLLGLRPNTLHYKLARHGLNGDKKKLDPEKD